MNKSPIPEWGTRELLAEICKRSENGEGVRDILKEKELPVRIALTWLRDHHHGAIVEAKKEQLKKTKEKAHGAG